MASQDTVATADTDFMASKTGRLSLNALMLKDILCAMKSSKQHLKKITITPVQAFCPRRGANQKKVGLMKGGEGS